MFEKLVEFFTGKKTQSKFADPLDAVTTPTVPQAPYKVPEPVVETPIPLVPVIDHPITVEKVSAEPAQPKQPKRTVTKKPAAIKPPVKPRAKKTP